MSIFLETKRLILKTPEVADFNILLALRSDPSVMQYTGYGETQTADEVKEYLNFAIAYENKHGMGFCLVFEKTSQEFIGEAGIFHLLFDDKQNEIEINYHLHKKFWGQGYATELSKALIKWGFEHLDINKIVATAYPENLASQQVLKKSGFDFRKKIKTPDDKELFWYETYKNDGIDLIDYDVHWPEMASAEIQKLYEVLPKNHIVDIQHVGSTAIPGMAAKPIIDIQIAVHSLEEMKGIAIPVLQKLGYEYWYENPDPERMFFVKGMPPFGEKRTHHVHIVEPTSKHWSGKINFRDYLIAHPEMAKEYQQLKIKLAEQHTYDREEYTNAKGEFVNKILSLVQQNTKGVQ
ncbi:MAG: GNAT family N-acetyltransferase [Gammaproteobacteria bacterium]|nr:GNAT family N-acetyltransferase [Gammaproteobacteria bacterium]